MYKLKCGGLKKRAKRKFSALAVLNGIQDSKDSTPEDKTAASKAKRARNDVWINKPTLNVTGLWNPKGTKLAGAGIAGGTLHVE